MEQLTIEIVEVISVGSTGLDSNTIIATISYSELSSDVLLGLGKIDHIISSCTIDVTSPFDGDITVSVGTNTDPFLVAAEDDSYLGTSNTYIVDTPGVESTADDIYRVFPYFTNPPTTGELVITLTFS